MATKRFTKKMLGPLDRAELRKIAIVGMGLEPLDAYTMKEAEVVSWIHERAEEFAGLSISGVGIEDTFRSGVGPYIKRLQKFILGDGTAPEWPPEPEDGDVEDSEAKEETAEKPEAAPPKRKRGRPRKDATAENKAPAKKATATKKKKAVATKKSAKTGFKKVETPAEEAAQVESVSAPVVQEAFDVSGLLDRLSSLEAQLQAVRQEQTDANNLLANALVYVVNTLIVDEDDDMIKDLTRIPNPSKYVK